MSVQPEQRPTNPRRQHFLTIYLYVFGIVNIFIVTWLPFALAEKMLWTPRNLPDEMMISSIYLAMGIAMIGAARHPTGRKAFVDFLIVANLLHALVMAVMAQNIWQILLDALPIAMMGAIPLMIYPWGLRNFMFMHPKLWLF